MPEITFKQMKEKQEKTQTFEHMRIQQDAWRPPTAEEEALEEDWGMFAASAVTIATTSLGIPAAITAGVATLLSDKGSEYLSEIAEEVHPALKIPTYIGSGILSAFTLEKWLINGVRKAHFIPKFWSKEFTLAAKKGILADQFVEDSANIIRRMDMGDTEATKKMFDMLRQHTYQDRVIKMGKQLERLQKAKKIIKDKEPISKLVSRLKKKKFLSNTDYQQLALVAKEDAVYKYNLEFDKIRTKVVRTAADAKWETHKMKDIVDAVAEGGGVSPSYKFANTEFRNTFMKRHPNLEGTKAIGADLRKIADDFNYTNIDDMITDIFQTPNRTMLRRIATTELQPEFNRIYRDEILVRIAEKEADYLFKLQGVKVGIDKKLVQSQAIKAVQRASTLPIHVTIKEVTSLKTSMQRLLRILQNPNINKAKLLVFQRKHAIVLAKYQAAVKIKTELGLINNRLKHITGIRGEYREQLQNLLAPLFKAKTKKLSESMFSFLARKYNDEVSIGADLLLKRYDGLLKNFPFSKRNFMELTFEQAKDLDEFVKAFRFVAHNDQYITLKAQKMLIRTLAKEINQEASTTVSRIKALRPPIIESQLKELSRSQKGAWINSHRSVADVSSGVLASLKRIEPICFQLDGFKTFGRAWKSIFNKAVMAEVAKEQLGRRVFGRYEEIFAAHKAATKIKPSKYWVATSGNLAGHDLSKETAVMIALNTKNADNMKAMLAGLDVSKKELIKFLDTALTTADWKVVDDILDSLDDLFPIIAKVYSQKTGLTLQRAVGGRYFPIMADRRFMTIRESIDDLFIDTTSDLFQAEVRKTFTELRIGGVKAVRLDFNALTQHLADVVHLTTHWTPINEIQRLTRNWAFKNAVETSMGRAVYEQFDPWLKNLARPSVTKIDKWMGKARRNVTAASLMLVPKIAVKQGLSFITAMPTMGYVNSMKALKEFIENPAALSKAIKEASPEMANRAKTWNRDLIELMSEVSYKGTKHSIQRIGYYMIHKVDSITASVVWLGSYKRGLHLFKGNGDLAVSFANKIVRKTQPASAPKDIPKIMRSGEGYRAISMFYSYWSLFHNQIAEVISKGLARHITAPQAIGTLAWMVIAPAVTQYLAKMAWHSLTGREQEEEHAKEIAKGIALNAVGGLPVARDLMGAIVKGYDYKVSPIIGVATETVDVAKALGKLMDEDEEITQYDIESVVKLGSYLRLYPSRAMITAVTGGLRFHEGATTDWSELIDRPTYKK